MIGRSEKRIVMMVVKDDPMLSVMANELVQEANLEAFVSDTDGDAYAYLKDHATEVASLFVDIGLRDSIDGIALAIATAAYHPHIRICIASAQTGPQPTELPPSVRYLPKSWHALEVMDFMLPD